MKNKNQFEKILYSKNKIIKKIKQLSSILNKYYENDKDVLVIPILDGSLVFAGHLIPYLDFDLTIESIKISSYCNNTFSNQDPQIKNTINKENIKNKKILLLEDLVDRGHTLKMIKKYLTDLGAKEVKTCVLFNKKLDLNEQKNRFEPDWNGFYIDDEWVAGFGIDSQYKLRNCQFMGIVKDEFKK